MKKSILMLAGMMVCAISVQAWHNASPEVLADSLQKESAETRMRKEAQQEEQSSQDITDELKAEEQAAEAERRAKQAGSRFNN